MPNKQRISRKLERVFLLQILFISIAVLLSIATARFVLGGILIQRALQDESDYFWQATGSIRIARCPTPTT